MKKLVKGIGKFLSILSLIFIIYAVWKLGLDFSGVTNWPAFILALAVGTAGKIATVFMSGTIWYGWVSFFAGRKADRKEALRVYTKANTGKYLPGNVMQYVERNLFADQMGVSQLKIAASSLIEVICLVLVAFITAFLFSFGELKLALTVVRDAVGDYFFLLVGAVFLIGIAGLLVIAYVFRKKVAGILKEYSLIHFLGRLLYSMLAEAVILTILGLIFVLLYIYMGGHVTLSSGMAIVAGYIIAWVLGFVVPGAPGGIGIRELVLTLLVGAVVGQELVMGIAIIHRLITIIGDFVAYLIGMILFRKKKEV